MNLFAAVVDEKVWHPNYRSLMKLGNGFVMDVLTDWARGFIDRDGKFVKEFQTTFNSCFWELYVYAVLKRYRLLISP
jgi:hypothetical protein